MRLHQALEQLEADLGVAMFKQRRGGHDVQGTEQPRGRPVAKVWIDILAPPGAALDLRDEMRGQETLLLHQSAGHRGPREHRRGGVLLVHAHESYALTIGVSGDRDQGFERVGYRQRICRSPAAVARDGRPLRGARRAEAEARPPERRPGIDAMAGASQCYFRMRR